MRAVIRRAKQSVQELIRSRAPGLAWHIDPFHRFEDRRVLIDVIFPYLIGDPGVQRVLFVGCDWYTKPYERRFSRKEYWTLEVEDNKRRYGAKRHIVAPLRSLAAYVAPAFFDAIICNGVFMVTAIETPEEAEPSFVACYTCLRPGGLFILGWNDTAELRPYPPEESETLARFRPFLFPSLATHRYLTDTGYRHVYSFFVKP